MRALFCLFVCLSLLALPAGLKRWTHSFHLARCVVPKIDSSGELFSKFPQKKIQKILSQPFYYLDRGAQSFVFASEDGLYVLKLFFFDSKKEKAAKTLASCRVAVKAAEETALIYLHEGPSNQKLPVVRLIGPAWRRSRLESGRYCFALQRRALPMKEALRLAYVEGDRLLVQQRLDSFFSLLKRRISMGIFNSDRNLYNNFGFLENGQAIEIDFGNYRQKPWSKEARDKEIARYQKKLMKWAGYALPGWKDNEKASSPLCNSIFSERARSLPY